MTAAAHSVSPVGSPRIIRRGGGLGRAGFWTYAVLSVFLIGSVFPVYWSFILATHTDAEIGTTPPALLPGGNLPANLRRVFSETEFAQAVVNTLLVAGSITVSMVFFSTLAGFAFAKLRFRGRRGLMLFVVVTMLVPPQLGVIPLYIIMSRLGWTEQLFAVVVPSLVTAFGVFFMQQHLAGFLPTELVEAARVDGCSTLRILWHVVFPLSRPAAAVLGMFTFVQAWNEYLWPLVVLTPDNATVQVALSALASGYHEEYSLVLTGAALATLPLLVLLALTGNQVINSLDDIGGRR